MIGVDAENTIEKEEDLYFEIDFKAEALQFDMSQFVAEPLPCSV